MFTEGWQVQLVELTRGGAVQPIVYSDRSFQGTQFLEPNDLTAITAIALALTRGDRSGSRTARSRSSCDWTAVGYRRSSCSADEA